MKLLVITVLLSQCLAARRSSHFSKTVNVGVYPGSSESELQMFIGTLEILLIKRDDVLQSLLTRNVGGVVMGHLAGSFYTGIVSEKQDCHVRMWIKDSELISGNIDCKRKHFVIERVSRADGQYVMHKKPQSHVKPHCQNTKCDSEAESLQKVCTLFIHTDPHYWQHIRGDHETAEETKETIIRRMVDHIMAANEMYGKYSFTENNFSVQFVLAGYQIDTDTQCQDYSSSSEYEYDPVDGDNLGLYDDSNDTLADHDYSIFDLFLAQELYEDEDWTPEYEEEGDVLLNDNNCYEDIQGVANISTEFCKLYLPDEGAHYLNMFSTVDHSSFCLAHIWTYR